jgi:hypothetical protein
MKADEKTFKVFGFTDNPIIIDFPNVSYSDIKNSKKGELLNYFYIDEVIFEKGLPTSAPWCILIYADIPGFYDFSSNKGTLLSLIPVVNVFNNNIIQYRKSNYSNDRLCIGRRDTIRLEFKDHTGKNLNFNDYSVKYISFRLIVE